MSKHNYSQYSNKKNYSKPEIETEPVTIETTNEVVDEPVIEVKMEAPKKEIETPVIGIVEGCNKLNVRINPSIEADVVTVINAKSEVVIDPAKSVNGWAKITTASGIEGYCMRKFVTVKL